MPHDEPEKGIGQEIVQPHPIAERTDRFWNRPLTASFRRLFTALARGMKDYGAGNYAAATAELAVAATAIGLRTPTEQLAWQLIERSLRKSVKDLIVESADAFTETEHTEDIIERASNTIDIVMDDVPVEISGELFARPGDIPIVQRMEKCVHSWALAMGLSPSEARGMSARLRTHFTFLINDEWQNHPEAYSPLSQLINSPFATAVGREAKWQLYSTWLATQANQRMFDETFSVSQVYVPPRASFQKNLPEDRNEALEDSDTEAPVHQVAWLRESLDSWLEQWPASDAIRVISGGPGTGKSTFARLFASETAKNAHCKVIYIPLHLFELKNDLVNAVHSFCHHHPYLPKTPLDPELGDRRLLLVFDGLDELEKQGRMAAEVASEFTTEVIRAVDRINQAYPRLMVLMCGRPVAVQAGESLLRKEENVLHILPYHIPTETNTLYRDPLNLLPTDQRNEWWIKYGQSVGKEYDSLPSDLNSDDLSEVTSQPLLNYLVALSYDRGALNFSKGVNLNLIYRSLLDAVYERAYEEKPNRSIEGLDKDGFTRVLEEIGLATWHGDGRTATVRRIETRCSKTEKVRRALVAFAGGTEAGVTRLLTAFYFRQHGNVEGEKTFEFTHKSFGEYLAACRIAREIKLLNDELRRRDDGNDGGFDETQALERLLDLCGPTELSHELHRFLKQEIATRQVTEVELWQKSLVRLINHLLRHGMPAERISPLPAFKELNRQSRNAEESLLAVLNACALHTRIHSNIDWPEATAFGAWLSRLAPQREGPRNVVALTALSYIDFSGQVLDMHDLYESFLSGSLGIDSRATNSVLTACDLQEANLAGASLNHASLNRANLYRANLSKSSLKFAEFRRANLAEANLELADLRGANLVQANLAQANLQGANLRLANLGGANFAGADLRGADLSMAAEARSANFDGAKLQRATLPKSLQRQQHIRQLNVDDGPTQKPISDVE
jgi:uncharacterized protein YjbI with pentapeptide repeats